MRTLLPRSDRAVADCVGAMRRGEVSRQRFKPTDAFVDESTGGRRYLMGCFLIEARHLGKVPSETAVPAADGKRRHFSHDTPEQRRDALRVFAEFSIRAFVTVVYSDPRRGRVRCAGCLPLRDRDATSDA
jgi:hypothetical protein